MDKKQAIAYLLSEMSDDADKIRGVSSNNILNGKVNPKIFDACKSLNFSLTANGSLYDNSFSGFLPDLMQIFYKERKTFKNKMIESKKDLEEINAELKRRGLTK